MKNKVVIWGTNAQKEKVLMALELKEAENKVLVYVIPEPIASDEFITKLNDEWRENKGTIEFPEGHTVMSRELNVTDSILPDDLKADRPDMVSRAQTEWHFIVLSGKLHTVYEQELADLREKVKALTEFDNGLWQNLRSFWDKVQEQSRERNLFRAHANTLRDTVNELFEEMKGVRKKVESEFSGVSVKIYEEITEKLAEIESRIEKGGNKMHIVFEDLKTIQAKYRTAKMTNEHRGKAYDRIDAAFKAAKEKRFGAEANEGSVIERHTRRLQGLVEAMDRMKDSARRDESELDFQRKKVQATEGQLEAQIRQAKIKMVEERLSSKLERIADMEKTKADIERQITSVNDREDKRQRIENAKASAKNEIAAITTKNTSRPPAAPVTENVPATQSVMDALTNVLGETFEDVVDTVKAVASVMADKAEEAMAKASVAANDAIEKATAVANDVAEAVTKDRSEAPTDAAADVADEVIAEVADEVAAPVEAAVAATEAVVETATETVVEAATEAVETATETVETATETVVEAATETVEAVVAETTDATEEVVAAVTDEVTEAAKPAATEEEKEA